MATTQTLAQKWIDDVGNDYQIGTIFLELFDNTLNQNVTLFTYPDGSKELGIEFEDGSILIYKNRKYEVR